MESQERSFTERLEQRAQRVVAAHRSREPDDPVLGSIVHEIEFVLDQINQTRSFDESRRHGLVQLECYIDTELMQMEARTPRYSPYRFPEREKLQRRLMTVALQHLRHRDDHFDRLNRLHRELRALLQKIDHLES